MSYERLRSLTARELRDLTASIDDARTWTSVLNAWIKAQGDLYRDHLIALHEQSALMAEV